MFSNFVSNTKKSAKDIFLLHLVGSTLKNPSSGTKHTYEFLYAETLRDAQIEAPKIIRKKNPKGEILELEVDEAK
jgi:hypothetical protein